MLFGTQYLRKNLGQPFSGEFRLRDYQTLISRTGHPYGKGILEDATGHLTAYWWGEKEPLLLEERAVMYVEGITKCLDGRTVVTMTLIRDRYLEGPEHGSRLIPQSLVHDPSVLLQCVEAIETLQTPNLRSFCDDVFTDLDFAHKFFTVPASLEHHHAFRGGLAEHSVAVALAAAGQQQPNATERDLAFVGGLLHDIGKILTCDPLRTRPVYLDHDLLTLEILSRPLAALDRRDSGLADRLRYLFTCKRAMPRMRPRTPSANAVWGMDRQNVALAMGKRANTSP